MTSEYNRAIRTAQRLLRAEAMGRSNKQVEVGYNQWVMDPSAAVYQAAARTLEALIEPDEYEEADNDTE